MTNKSNQIYKELYNGTVQSLNAVIPVDKDYGKPEFHTRFIEVSFGVLIKISGDVKGALLMQGSQGLFSELGEAIYGMRLEGEMVSSFSCELGNMVAGNLATNVAKNGIETDITYPTIVSGTTKLSDYKRTLLIPIKYRNVGDLKVSLLFS